MKFLLAIHAAGRRIAPVALALALVTGPATDEDWVYPVGPPGGPADVVRGLDLPADPWLAGHRGVDLRAPAGSEVRSAGAGEVTYAGLLAGRGVVVVQHATLRTTYEPVDASVSVGTRVAAGDPIGVLAELGGHCPPDSCLHWGAIQAGRYIDPLTLVSGSSTVRLLPLGGRALTEGPPPRPPQGPGRLGWPVTEPRVTSPYGMRTHPVTGERRLHDGTDFAAACGTPIRASAAGRVTGAGHRGAYGLQVALDHGMLGGVSLTTSYSHLSRMSARAGQRLAAGAVVGWAGTTGLSTGCHLHFMVYAGGVVDDPMKWLPARAR